MQLCSQCVSSIKSKILKLIGELDLKVFLTNEVKFYYFLLGPIHETAKNVEFGYLDQLAVYQTNVCWYNYTQNQGVKNHLK